MSLIYKLTLRNAEIALCDGSIIQQADLIDCRVYLKGKEELILFLGCIFERVVFDVDLQSVTARANSCEFVKCVFEPLKAEGGPPQRSLGG